MPQFKPEGPPTSLDAESATADTTNGARQCSTSCPGAASGCPTSLPVHKLQCRHPSRQPVVLVACGSYNPPTIMHMRMFDLATDALAQEGINMEVWGGYLSPVSDAYGKKGLAPGAQRLAMCEAAASDHPSVMCDPWELSQQQYTRTLAVLRRFQAELQEWWDQGGRPLTQCVTTSPAATTPAFEEKEEEGPSTSCHTAELAPLKLVGAAGPHASRDGGNHVGHVTGPPRVMLLCGEDVLLSMTIPGVWESPDELLQEFGAVCVERQPAAVTGQGQGQGQQSSLQAALEQEGSVLHRCRTHIHSVRDEVQSTISSTLIRQQLQRGHSVRYLVPGPVLRHLEQHPEVYAS